ncbi:MAG: hypothetical protein WCW14_01335 [Candidatus Paceibacterota bacterium]
MKRVIFVGVSSTTQADVIGAIRVFKMSAKTSTEGSAHGKIRVCQVNEHKDAMALIERNLIVPTVVVFFGPKAESNALWLRRMINGASSRDKETWKAMAAIRLIAIVDQPAGDITLVIDSNLLFQNTLQDLIFKF